VADSGVQNGGGMVDPYGDPTLSAAGSRDLIACVYVTLVSLVGLSDKGISDEGPIGGIYSHKGGEKQL